MKLLFTLILMLVTIPSVLFGMNARIETMEGEVLTIKDFSMEGRRHFYIEWKGGTSTLDWKDITSFDIIRIGPNYWVEVLLSSGQKESFKVRQFYSFRGKTDFGQWSIPFEKMKRAFLIGDATGEKGKADVSMKEANSSLHPEPKLIDKITMRNGDILLGSISNDIVSIKTKYGTLTFKKEDILRVTLGMVSKPQKEREWDTLYSKYGDKLTGIISDPQIKITLHTRTDINLFREYIKEIEFGVVADTEQKGTQEEKSTESSPQILPTK